MSQYQPPNQPPQPGSEPWQQQPQQNYPPQWAQQPGYPPQQPVYQPPQKKKSRKGLWIVLGIVAALVVFGCIGTFLVINAAGNSAQHALNQASTQVANIGTPQATQPAHASTGNALGKPVQAGDWQVTVNKLSTSTGSEFDTPKAGNIFLVVNVTLKNTSSSSQAASSLGMFALKDTSGQTYQQDITASGAPDGNVAAGSLIRGNLQYETPKSAHDFILQFTPGLDASQLVEWTIKD